MATNPPITIGPFTNVPAPGSGVKSDWPQQISNYVAPTAWVNVTFQNGWVNRATGQVVQYRKEGDIIRVRGHCQGGTMGASIFTLPAGFRPPAGENIFPTVCGASNNTLGTILVDGAGSVYAWVGVNAAFELNVSFSTVA